MPLIIQAKLYPLTGTEVTVHKKMLDDKAEKNYVD